jgi:chorismate dehydratase
MSSSDELPKLRLAPQESPEDLSRRLEKEQRAAGLQRESELEQSLAPYRVGSVPYLNSVPLTRGLEDQIHYAPPSQLAEMLRRDELDAALVSVTEVLFNDRYEILDGIAVASLGEVKSVFLAHRPPLEEVKEIHCDPASLTSVYLLKVLLAERGLTAEFKPLTDYTDAPNREAVLLIGNPAIDFLRGCPDHRITDLGAAWYELTGLPFVYAVWALHRNRSHEPLRRRLRDAWDFGRDTLDYLIRHRTEYDYDFRKDYLGWHIHYHMGSEEKRGLARFIELLRKHGFGPVHTPQFVASP